MKRYPTALCTLALLSLLGLASGGCQPTPCVGDCGADPATGKGEFLTGGLQTFSLNRLSIASSTQLTALDKAELAKVVNDEIGAQANVALNDLACSLDEGCYAVGSFSEALLVERIDVANNKPLVHGAGKGQYVDDGSLHHRDGFAVQLLPGYGVVARSTNFAESLSDDQALAIAFGGPGVRAWVAGDHHGDFTWNGESVFGLGTLKQGTYLAGLATTSERQSQQSDPRFVQTALTTISALAVDARGTRWVSDGTTLLAIADGNTQTFTPELGKIHALATCENCLAELVAIANRTDGSAVVALLSRDPNATGGLRTIASWTQPNAVLTALHIDDGQIWVAGTLPQAGMVETTPVKQTFAVSLVAQEGGGATAPRLVATRVANVPKLTNAVDLARDLFSKLWIVGSTRAGFALAEIGEQVEVVAEIANATATALACDAGPIVAGQLGGQAPAIFPNGDAPITVRGRAAGDAFIWSITGAP
ncbi:MAG: hypothetical protein H6707_00290 [Deltaproteobacteria bacterium]|nr:hypothetical protein [Deltaproteobacteria bacterium]